MNTGDLQYVAGDLYVAGTITSGAGGGGGGGGVSSVTSGNPKIGVSPTSGAVTLDPTNCLGFPYGAAATAYSATSQYGAFDCVVSGSTIYYAIQENGPPNDVQPVTNTAYWLPLSAGSSPTVGQLQFPNGITAYINTKAYVPFDCVVAGTSTYYCINASTGNSPLTSPAFWTPFGSGGGGITAVTATAPITATTTGSTVALTYTGTSPTPPVNMFYGGGVTVGSTITGLTGALPTATSTNFRSVAFQNAGFQTDGTSTYVFSGMVTFVINQEFIPASFAALGTTTIYLCEGELNATGGGARPVGQNIIAILQLSAYEMWPLFNNGNSAATITRSVNAVIKSTTAGPISLGFQNSSIQENGSNVFEVEILVNPGVSYLSYQRFPAPPAVAEASAFAAAPTAASLSIPPAVRLLSAAPPPRARAAPKAASAGVTRKPTLSAQLRK